MADTGKARAAKAGAPGQCDGPRGADKAGAPEVAEADALQALARAGSFEMKTELQRTLRHLRAGRTRAAETGLSQLIDAFEREADFWVHRKWHDEIEAQARALALIEGSDETYRQVLVDELKDALDRAETDADPFAHFVIDGVFSQSTYIALLLSAPHITLMRPLASPEYFHNGRYQRYQMAIAPRAFEAAHQRVGKAWTALAGALRDPGVVSRLCARLGIEMPAEWTTHARLQIDRAGARIRPHTDGENGGLLTFQMYFPLNRENYETGTRFFKKTPKGFVPARKMPYQSNFAYGFRIGAESWHGADAPLGTLSEGRLSLVMRVRAGT